jgi:valyl-tRNA synthetase
VRDVRFVDDASEASMALVQRVIAAVRGIRAEKNIPSSARLGVILTVADDYKKTILEGYKRLVAEQGKCAWVRVRRTGSITLIPEMQGPTATAMAGEVEVSIPLEGLVDSAAEKAKLEKEKEKLVTERAYLGKKLENPKFVANAKAEILEKDRARLAELETAVARVEAALARL